MMLRPESNRLVKKWASKIDDVNHHFILFQALELLPRYPDKRTQDIIEIQTLHQKKKSSFLRLSRDASK